MVERVFLSLGSNMGDRFQFLRRAVLALSALPGTALSKCSRIFETSPVGVANQGKFYNIVVEMRTALSLDAFFGHVRDIERSVGRKAVQRWGPREIDIDLLLFGETCVQTGDMTVPHPEMHRRRFVLVPLCELAPEVMHPVERHSCADLLAACPDSGDVQPTTLTIDTHDKEQSVPTLPTELRHIAIEGVIGAGKTSLTHMLAERLGAKVVLEQFEENPFLAKFYEDQERYAFQTQIFFLLSRYRQQQQFHQADLFHHFVVSDYIFEKDKIFAYLNLKDDELKLYDMMVSAIERNIPAPDLVVYLQCSTERLMANIRKRGRQMESHMEERYIRDLNEAYNYFFFRYKTAPLLIVKATDIDFVNNKEDMEELLKQILRPNRAPVEYYNPMVKRQTES